MMIDQEARKHLQWTENIIYIFFSSRFDRVEKIRRTVEPHLTRFIGEHEQIKPVQFLPGLHRDLVADHARILARLADR